MAKTRSPNYPTATLGTALAAIKPAFKAEHRNKMSRLMLAKHLGYSSLNGRALTKLGAVRAYGLIEGAGDEIRVSDDAITLLNAPEGSEDRAAALLQCAMRPMLFQEIRKQFPTPPSLENLKFFLIKLGYTPEAAERAAQSYLGTMALVSGVGGDYISEEESEVGTQMQTAPSQKADRQPSPMVVGGQPKRGTRQAVFPLIEGDLTLTFPDNLSASSASAMVSYVTLFLKQAEAQAKERERLREEHGQDDK